MRATRQVRHSVAFAVLAMVGLLSCGPGDSNRFALGAEAGAVADRYASKLADDVTRDSIGSIIIAVVDGGTVVWSRGFGWADRDRHLAARVDGIYRTGSISKTFTAVLLLQLAERGVVKLDDKVVDILPEFAAIQGAAEQVNSITLRQLASHTSGLVREPGLEGAASGPIAQWEQKILAAIPTTALQTAPGAAYSYSNIGFGILGLALSRAAGRPFMDLVEEMIFQPLGMESTTFVIQPTLQSRLAVGYANGDGTVDSGLPAREHLGRGYKVPNGGIYSTAADLGRFIGGLTGSTAAQILTAESRAEMQQAQTPPEGGQYGLGLSIRTTESGIKMLGHGGSVAGYTAYMLFEPESKLGVVLLRNYNRGATDLAETAGNFLGELVAVTGRVAAR